jgi:MoaA/NifB/PqqE/SkfB family radical SAM enzyme
LTQKVKELQEGVESKPTYYDGIEIFALLSWALTKSQKSAKIASKFLDRYLYITEKTLLAKFLKGRSRHPALKIASRVLNELNSNCRRAFIDNFLLKAVLEGSKKRYRVKNGEREVLAPVTVLISPTMRCNLKCTGCYASDYTKGDDLSLDLIDKVIREGKEMGVYFYTILGGEPFLRPDLFEVYRRHRDAVFQVFTNSWLLDKETCNKLAELGNVAPMISIEGFEKETDERRGKGVFKRAVESMRLLRERGVFFGISVVPTRFNTEVVTSDEFIDFILEEGAFVLWYFLYMPVGKAPDLNLMPHPYQRNKIRLAAQKIRAEKPLLVVDFWGDAPLVGGCIAGREYIHINSNGDVEPCIFCHFAVDNIKERSLKEAFHSQFMKNIRKRIPYSSNLLKPCMIIDNPRVLHEICRENKPRPTHPEAEKLLQEFAPALESYAAEVSRVFDPIWEAEEVKELRMRSC